MRYLKVGGLFLALGICVYISGLIVMNIKKELEEELWE